MRFVTGLVAMVFALTATASISAQGRGQGQAKKTTVSAPKAKSTEAPKHTTTTTKTETRTAKAETRAAKTAAKTDTRAAKAETKAARKAGTTTTTTTTTTDVTPTTATTDTVKNPKLEARLLTLLPGVTDINAASQGFKNWGQFVAAAHVSTNLGIPFAELKSRMTGILPGATVPTAAPMSLGQAIQNWKTTGTTAVTATTPLTSTQIQNEVKKAESAANSDLRRSRERS